MRSVGVNRRGRKGQGKASKPVKKKNLERINSSSLMGQVGVKWRSIDRWGEVEGGEEEAGRPALPDKSGRKPRVNQSREDETRLPQQQALRPRMWFSPTHSPLHCTLLTHKSDWGSLSRTTTSNPDNKTTIKQLLVIFYGIWTRIVNKS